MGSEERLCSFTSRGQPFYGNGAVAAVAMKLAIDKASLPFDHACSSASCAMSSSARPCGLPGGSHHERQVLAVLFPVSAFVVAAFEHSMANMYLIPLELFLKARRQQCFGQKSVQRSRT